MLNEQLEFDLDDQRSLSADNDNRPPLNKYEAKWREFHAENPEVYDLIELYAYKAIAAGRSHYGMQTILEMVRWHTMLRNGPDEDGYKVNNNHAAYYARLFHAENPRHDGFFKTRMLSNSGGRA